MIDIHFSARCINENETVKKKITKHFILFLKRNKLFYKFTPFILKIQCEKQKHFSVASLYNTLAFDLENYMVPEGRALLRNEEDLKMSQLWRIYLLDNFKDIFGDLEKKNQDYFSEDIILKLMANKARFLIETLNAIKRFKESK